MKKISEWLSARASMNQCLHMAIVCSNASDRAVSMDMVLLYLLEKNYHQSKVLEHWSAMTYNERCMAMEIAF